MFCNFCLKYNFLFQKINHPSLPYLMFSVACFFSIACLIVLPKTLGFVAPQTIEEALNRKTTKSKVCCITVKN